MEPTRDAADWQASLHHAIAVSAEISVRQEQRLERIPDQEICIVDPDSERSELLEHELLRVERSLVVQHGELYENHLKSID